MNVLRAEKEKAYRNFLTDLLASMKKPPVMKPSEPTLEVIQT